MRFSNGLTTSNSDDDLINPSNIVSPLNFGQIINGGRTIELQNVTYCDLSLGDDFPPNYRRFIPNVYYQTDLIGDGRPRGYEMRLIALIATRDLRDEELFSNYDFIARPGP